MKKLESLLDKFKDRKILVIGDVMLDKYVFGKVNRISPEAPVQIVEVEKEIYVPGGAANVSNNISSLGATAYLIGVTGNDSARERLLDALEKNSIEAELIIDQSRPTTQKERIMGQNQQLLRIDRESKAFIDNFIEEMLIEKIKNLAYQIDGIVLSDYAKGVITEHMSKYIISLARGMKKPIVVDPKPKHKNFYANATLITPNAKEASEMTGIEEKTERDLISIGNELMRGLNSNVLITRGEKGMTVFDKEGKIVEIPTKAKQVYDVTGAGDTVTAIVALALASGADLRSAAEIANHGAGIVVGKVGTATVRVDELKKSLENDG